MERVRKTIRFNLEIPAEKRAYEIWEKYGFKSEYLIGILLLADASNQDLRKELDEIKKMLEGRV